MPNLSKFFFFLIFSQLVPSDFKVNTFGEMVRTFPLNKLSIISLQMDTLAIFLYLEAVTLTFALFPPLCR